MGDPAGRRLGLQYVGRNSGPRLSSRDSKRWCEQRADASRTSVRLPPSPSFIVMASDNVLTRKILNSPNHTEPCLVASAKQILDPNNWVFLNGKVHADYRKALNGLFTRRALAIYLKMQERIYSRTFNEWLDANRARTAAGQGPEPYMMRVRDLNMETSLRVFCGNYLPEHACQEISHVYWDLTRALELVNFPLALPGTKVYKAIKGRKRVMTWCVPSSSRLLVVLYPPATLCYSG